MADFQNSHFAKAIALAWAIGFARWPIFKFVSFLEYLVFFRAVFCIQQLKCSCGMPFSIFKGLSIFHPN